MAPLRLAVAILVLGAAAYAEAVNPAYLAQQAHKAEKKGRVIDAYLLYAQAAAADPNNRGYWARAQALRTRATLAGGVLPTLRQAPGTLPESAPPPLTPEDEKEARRPQPPTELAAGADKHTFHLRTDAKSLFEQVAKSYGLDVVFDGDYQPGLPVRFDLENGDYREALYMAQTVTNSFIVPISPRLFMVVKDTTQKRAEQEAAMALTVPIPEPVSVQETQELARTVQQAMELPKFAIDSSQRLVFIRGPVSKVEPARALLLDMLRRRPQVYLEVDLLNVTKSSSLSLGLSPQNTFRVAADTASKALNAFSAPLSYLRVGIASVELLASMSISSNDSLLHSELRSVDNQPVSIHVGDKYPIVAQTLGPVISPGGGTVGRTFEYTELPAQGTRPGGRSDAALIYDAATRRIYLFGGRDATAVYRDLWVYSITDQAWSELSPIGIRPDARYGHSMVIDRRGRLIVFGGRTNSTSYSDIWMFNPATNTWQQLAGADAGPSARYGQAAIYEPLRDLVVVTHGCTTDGRVNDTWAFDLVGNAWTDLKPVGTLPPAGCGQQAAYVSTTGQMMMFGGCGDSEAGCPLGDLWAFDFLGNQWFQLATTGDKPPARQRFAMSYDPVRGVLYLFGGEGVQKSLDDTWVFDLTTRTWNRVSITGTGAGARSGPSLIAGTSFAGVGEFVLFGGQVESGFPDGLLALRESETQTSTTGTVDQTLSSFAFAPPPQFTFEDLGLSMKLTPKVHDSQEVSLELEVEFKTLAGTGFNGIPVISNRRFASRARLKFGEAAVVSGLMTSGEATTVSGMAGITGVPVFGTLLSRNTRQKDSGQALLVIRPRLIDAPPSETPSPTIWTGTESRPRIPL